MRDNIRREVLRFLQNSPEPARVSRIATELRAKPNLGTVRDSDVRAIVQPMIVTGKLNYAPGLKIKIGHANQ